MSLKILVFLVVFIAILAKKKEREQKFENCDSYEESGNNFFDENDDFDEESLFGDDEDSIDYKESSYDDNEHLFEEDEDDNNFFDDYCKIFHGENKRGELNCV
ncbi:2032_t:CDS:1 [Acaulospora morrowiae]|uniref:2032_t:CDS:1 n=1 Tax=Acaulospora morrowiae TaxID=94023 RepID=A0A9N9AK75_9GLOM|nr:2032_t:CDS:1 [Acaulospora morrowiae]